MACVVSVTLSMYVSVARMKEVTRKLCYRKDVRAMCLGIFDRFAQSDNTHMVHC